MYPRETARVAVVVPGQVQHAVYDVERQLGRDRCLLVPPADSPQRQDARRGPLRHIAADDDLALDPAAAALGAQVERQHVGSARDAAVVSMQRGHAPRADHGDRQPPPCVPFCPRRRPRGAAEQPRRRRPARGRRRNFATQRCLR